MWPSLPGRTRSLWSRWCCRCPARIPEGSALWSCQGWLCSPELPMSNPQQPLSAQSSQSSPSSCSTRGCSHSTVGRAQKGRGLCSLPGAPQPDEGWDSVFPRSSSPALSSSSTWLDACTPLPPACTDLQELSFCSCPHSCRVLSKAQPQLCSSAFTATVFVKR